MIDIIKLVAIALLCLIAFLIVKPLKPDIAVFIALSGVVIIFINIIDGVVLIVETMTAFAEKTGINTTLFGLVLKIVGTGYIIEFASNICSNAGNSSLAEAICLAGKIAVLIMSLPILKILLDLIIKLIPEGNLI